MAEEIKKKVKPPMKMMMVRFTKDYEMKRPNKKDKLIKKAVIMGLSGKVLEDALRAEAVKEINSNHPALHKQKANLKREVEKNEK